MISKPAERTLPCGALIVAALAGCAGGGGSGSDFAEGKTLVGGPIAADVAWNRAGSPYVVIGDVVVERGVILAIEPGVEVLFRSAPRADATPSGHAIVVLGTLVAEGAEDEPIVFRAERPPQREDERWNHVRFAPESSDANFDAGGACVGGSRLRHVEFADAGNSAIFAERAAPFLEHCVFRGNASLHDKGDEVVIDPGYNADQRVKGGAVYAWRPRARLAIRSCVFEDNLADGMGGALAIVEAETRNLEVSGCSFLRNAVTRGGHGAFGGDRMGVAHGGGAVRLLGASARIVSCRFDGNGAEAGGAIHASYGSDCEILASTFDSNEADELGGALFVAHRSDALVASCAFRANRARAASGAEHGGRGGAIALIGRCAPVLVACLFEDNVAESSGGAISADQQERPARLGTLVVTDSTFAGNSSAPGSASLYFARYDAVEVTRCRILGYAGRAVEVTGGVEVIARHDWWGTDDAAEIEAAILDRSNAGSPASVEYRPFETEP